MVEGGKMKMKREERNEFSLTKVIALGLLIGILCFAISALIANAGKKALENVDRISYPHLSYEEWIAIHESYFSYEDAQSAYYKYEEGFYTPEYREAQKKCTPYKVGAAIFFLMGTITIFFMGGTIVIIVSKRR